VATPSYNNYPAYRSAFDKQQRLYLEVFGGGPGSRARGLAGSMDDIAQSKGESSPEYKRVKAAFDAKQKEYETALAESNRIRKEIDDAFNAEQEQKTKGKKQKEAKATKQVLESKRDSLRRQNKLDEADAVQKEIDGLNAPKSEETEALTGEEQGGFYDDYSISQGAVNGPGNLGAGVFVDIRKDGKVAPQFFNSLDKARQAFLKEYYSGPGKVKELQNQLLASNYIKQEEIEKGTWYTGIDELLIASTMKRVSDAKYGGLPEVPIQDFLKLKQSGSGSGETRINRNISTRGDARTMLNMYMSDLAGMDASEEEHDAFYKELNRSEMRETSYTKDGSTVGSVMTDAERLLIAAKVAKKKLRNTEVDTILNSANGSRAAVDIAELQRTAADYGIQMGAGEALRYIADGIGQANYLEKQKERLRLIAIKMNPNIADHIQAGGNVRELADVYGNIKSRKLGVVVKDSVFDKDVLEAVNKGKSAAQFETELQGHPDWRFTPEAREIGADFINTMGRMWGRG
jgi:hypothetical protein